MKKFTLISGIALISGVIAIMPKASAQITITSADLPSVGLIVVTDSDGTTKPAIGSIGGPQNWNFSGLLKQKTKTIDFMTPSATKYASIFTAADLADSTIGGNGYNYFITNTSLFAVEGAEEVVPYTYGSNTYYFQPEINLDPTFVQANLPATMGSTAAGTAYGTEIFNQSILIITQERISTSIIYSDTVDAYGTMKMPNGYTYNVLRQKHHEEDIDSILVYSLIGGWSLASTTISYKNQYDWYTNGVGYILAEMDMSQTWDTLKDIVWDTTSLAPTSVPEIGLKNSINVFPNPSNSKITFANYAEYPLADQYLYIYNTASSEIEKITVKNGLTSLNTSNYPAGVYLYRMTDNSGNIVDQGKFVVQH